MGHNVMLRDNPESQDGQNCDKAAEIEPVESSASVTEYEYENWNCHHHDEIRGIQDIVEQTVISRGQIGDQTTTHRDGEEDPHG